MIRAATVADAIDAAGGLAFVWEEAGDVVGFVCGHDLGFRAYLSELVVAERARHRGIARRYRSLGWQPPDAVLLRRRLGW